MDITLESGKVFKISYEVHEKLTREQKVEICEHNNQVRKDKAKEYRQKHKTRLNEKKKENREYAIYKC